jgi:predicted Zn finger-like uncharacterized protein
VLAQCPQCATKVQIDDAKVPDKPFRVRCPKCQGLISLPGRAAAPADPASAAFEPPPPAPEPPAAGAPVSEAPPPAASPFNLPAADTGPSAAPDAFAVANALARREKLQESHNDALVALAGPAAAHLHAALEKLGYRVDTVDDVEEGARLLEQGAYELAVTARDTAAAGRPATLSQRILRLPSEARRRVFVVLVGDDFRSGDGTQAWSAQADLVLSTADTARADGLVRATLAERRRLYQPFLDARRKIESD